MGRGVADLQFVEVVDNTSTVGDLRFAFSGGDTADEAQAWAYLPGPYAAGGDVWFSNSSTSYSSGVWSLGSYEYLTVIHEVGHTLGLKHPFDDTPAKNGGITLPKSLDAGSYTVMSYSAFNGDNYTYFNYDPTTPMVLDIAAMQYIYGANTTYNNGDNVYAFNGADFYNETIWDAGGTDTIVYASTVGGLIDLRQGAAYGSRVGQDIEIWRGSKLLGAVNNVWIANGAVIENATGGSGNDRIFGNEANNLLDGAEGSDVIAGGAGDDVYTVALKQVDQGRERPG
jgi:serralysin